MVRTIDELVGGLSHRSLDSGRVDSRSQPCAATLSFSDIAVLYRTDAQSGPIVEALSRAGVPVQKRSHNRLRDRAGVQVIARELRHAGGLGGSLAARVKLTAQVLAQRYAAPTLDAEQLAPGGHLGRRRPADAAGPADRRRSARLSAGDRDRCRGGRARPARRGGQPAHPARRQGPGVPGGLPGRLRGRPAAAALAGQHARRRGDRRGAPPVLRRPDPRPGPALPLVRRAPVPPRQRARAASDARSST